MGVGKKGPRKGVLLSLYASQLRLGGLGPTCFVVRRHGDRSSRVWGEDHSQWALVANEWSVVREQHVPLVIARTNP